VTDEPRAALTARINAVEEGYEFMLAYAAQGREDDEGSGPGSSVRHFLGRIDDALDGLVQAVVSAGATGDASAESTAGAEFVSLIGQDAKNARTAVRFALAQPRLSSQLIDNLNASIHLRALLTDLFLVDEALQSHPST